MAASLDATKAAFRAVGLVRRRQSLAIMRHAGLWRARPTFWHITARLEEVGFAYICSSRWSDQSWIIRPKNIWEPSF